MGEVIIVALLLSCICILLYLPASLASNTSTIWRTSMSNKKNTAHLSDTAKTLKDSCRSGYGCGIMVYTNKGPNDCQCPFPDDCNCAEVTTTMWKKALKEMNKNG